MQAQNIVLPLRLDTEVYSGIAPPAEVLQRMAEARTNGNIPSQKPDTSTAAMDEKLRTEGRKSSVPGPSSAAQATSSEPDAPEIPARPGRPVPQQPQEYEDAPPSYEDAIATDLPPVNAPRPDYAPPPTGDDQMLGQDEKKGWVDFREV